MKIKLENKYVQLGLTLFLTALSIMIVYFLFFRLQSIKQGIAALNKILAPISYGLVIAYLITPLLNSIERKCIIPLVIKIDEKRNKKTTDKTIRGVSLLISITIIVFFFYLFFASVVPEVYRSVQNIVSQYSTYTNNLVNYINKQLENNPEFAKLVSDLVYDYSNQTDDLLNDVVMPAVQSMLLPNLSDFISSFSQSIVKVFSFTWNIIIGLIISIYVLISKERFAKSCTRLTYAMLERNSANSFIEGIRFTHRTFIGFLSGKVVDSLIIGIICYICCLIMKMPYASLISLIVGVTNIIPFFGPYIGAIPSTILILLVDPVKALYFIIFILILQQFDGNFLGPLILSQSTGLTSFWIIVSITLFGGLFGILGMIIGVPVTAVILTFINNLTNKSLIRKQLPTDTDKYKNVGYINEEGEIITYIPPEKKSNKEHKNSIKVFFVKIHSFIKKIITKIKKKK